MFRSILLGALFLGVLYLAFWWFKVEEFTSLEKALSSTEKVTFLNLSHQKIKTIPTSISKLQDLEILWLDDNPDIDLNQTCKTLRTLPKLRALVISGCHIDTLPKYIALLRHLTVLDLSDNPKIRLDLGIPALVQLSELTALSVTACHLKDLPPGFEKIKSLKKVFLMKNSIPVSRRKYWQTQLPDCNFEYEE
jgi:Leucine-rich repeat (LRR) protein